ncbi:MAG: HAD family hydrolase [Spirochaetae bacterium HGW-Spirochaetae-4]|nr:MAG: HAD family hydrolase [Spirochaetae bacterium HGW-Spirochaetae-8]PKL20796.1 MAG: HAD family hydrolase [Spirochaetae bacterium HGW-Spirochaetae-4]
MSRHPIRTLLFDLDGTLLPMDQSRFMQAYLEAFAGKCIQLSLPVRLSLKALDTGFKAMLANDGSMTNEKRFWLEFSAVMGFPIDDRIADFISFYHEEFTRLRVIAQMNPISRQLVETVRANGYRIVLATSPVFPRQGTLERISWADLDPSWFEMITTYEDFSYAKPSLGYYNEILSKLELDPTQCLMVGNDVEEDLVARQLGMDVYLVTDWLINRTGADISDFKQGTLQEAFDYCSRLGVV